MKKAQLLEPSRVEELAMAMWAEDQLGPRSAWSTIRREWAKWSDLVRNVYRRKAKSIAKRLIALPSGSEE